MAIIKTGAIIGAISGKLGGVTFANTPAGLVAKQSQTRQPAPTRYTYRANAIRKMAATAWAAKSTSDQLAWNRAAMRFATSNRLGISRLYSGVQMFTHWYMAMFRAYGAVSAPPPPTERAGAFYAMVLSFTYPQTHTIAAYNWSCEASDAVEVQLAISYKISQPRYWRQWQVNNYPAYSQFPINCHQGAKDHFSRPFPVGTWVAVRLRVLDDYKMPGPWIQKVTQVQAP